MWACDAVLSLLLRHVAAVVADEDLTSVVFYGFLRLAADHQNEPRLAELQKRELELCLRLWEEAPRVCARGGRDMVRALQDVARHPVAERIWLSVLGAQVR